MGQMRPMGALENASPISPIGLICLIGLISLAPTLHSQPSTLNSQLSRLSSLVFRLLKHNSHAHLHTPAREEVVA